MADDTHDELLEEYDGVPPRKARLDTLHIVSFDRLQSLASDAGVHTGDDDAADLREKLAEEGYFVGPVGDDTVYKLDHGEAVEVAESTD